MSLRETLRAIVDDVEGGVGAAIMGCDGIAIDEYVRERVIDLPALAVEYVHVVKEVRHTVSVLESGDLEEIDVLAGSVRVVIRPLGDDLFLLLAVKGEGNYGKARYLMRRHISSIREALA